MKSLYVAVVSAMTTAVAAVPALAQEASTESFLGLNLGWLFPGLGNGTGNGTTPSAVPEIDASTALVSLAALAAVLAFAWERKRRQA